MEKVVIGRTKFWPGIQACLGLLVCMMFFVFPVIAVVTGSMDFWFEYVFLIFPIFMSTLGLFSLVKISGKFFFDNPELELTDSELIVYDNPEINKLPFLEMKEAMSYYTRYAPTIAIAFREESKYGKQLPGFRRVFQNIPIEKSKVILLNVDFADIEKQALIKLINERILLAQQRGR